MIMFSFTSTFNQTQAEVAAKWWAFILKNDLANILAEINQTDLIPIIMTTEQESNFIKILSQLIWEECLDPFGLNTQTSIQIDYKFVKKAIDQAGIGVYSDNFIVEVVDGLMVFVKQDGSVTYQNGYDLGDLYKNNQEFPFKSRFSQVISESVNENNKYDESYYFSQADKYVVINKLQNDYAKDIFIEILSRKQNHISIIDCDDIIKHSNILSRLHDNLEGLEAVITHLQSKKEDIQRVIKQYVYGVFLAMEVSSSDNKFLKFYDECTANSGKNLILKLFKVINESKIYPDEKLDQQLTEIENISLIQTLRGITILLHLKSNDLPNLKRRQLFLKNEIEIKLGIKKNIQPQKDYMKMDDLNDPMDMFNKFFSGGLGFYPSNFSNNTNNNSNTQKGDYTRWKNKKNNF